jgi:hypothetical protein
MQFPRRRERTYSLHGIGLQQEREATLGRDRNAREPLASIAVRRSRVLPHTVAASNMVSADASSFFITLAPYDSIIAMNRDFGASESSPTQLKNNPRKHPRRRGQVGCGQCG